MAEKYSLEMIIEGISGLDALEKKLAEAYQTAGLDPKATAPFVKKLTQGADSAGKKFFDAVGRARPVQLVREMEKVQQSYLSFQRGMEAKALEVIHLEAKIKSEISTEEKASLRARVMGIKTELSLRQKAMDEEFKLFEKTIEEREELLKTIKSMDSLEGAGRLGSAGEDLAKSFLQGLESAGPDDLRKFASAFARGVGGAGKAAQVVGGRMAGGAGAAAGIGKGLAGLGTSMAAIAGPLAAIVGVLGGIAAIFMIADKQTKDFNSSLLEGAGAADVFASATMKGVQGYRDSLEQARAAAFELSWQFREQPDEIMKIVAAANEYGLTMQEIEKNFSNTGNKLEAYVNMNKIALTYSHSLGVSTREIAESTANWVHDFGAGLNTIEEGFNAIYKAAHISGIGAKRFFGFVSQATGGLALYNTRVEEAAYLIANLAGALGEAGAAEFVSGLTKGFAADSYTERFKKLVLAGEPAVKKVFEENAKAVGVSFGKTMEDTGLGRMMGMELAKKGIDWEKLKSGSTEALKQLADLPPDQARSILAELQDRDEEAGKQFQGLLGAVEALKGGISNQAKAMDELGPGGVLAIQLAQANAITNKPLSEMSAYQLAAFETATGVAGEQLHALQRLEQSMRADFEAQQDTADGIQNWTQYMISRKDEIANAVETPMQKQERLAIEMVKETRTIASMMGTVVQRGFEKANKLLSLIVPRGQGETELQRMEIQDKIADRLASLEASKRSAKTKGEVSTFDESIEQWKAFGEEAETANEGRLAQMLENLAGRGSIRLSQGDILGIGPNPDLRHPRLTETAISAGESLNLHTEQKALAYEIADSLKAPTKAQTEEEIAEMNRLQDEEFKWLEKQNPLLTKKGYLEALKVRDMQKVAQAAQLAGVGGDVLDILTSGGKLPVAYATAVNKFLNDPMLIAQFADANWVPGSGEEDFIYRAGKGVTSINSADDLIGGKAGGPVAEAFASGGGGGGAMINIYGGDTAKVYNVVKKALQESGVRPRPGGR